MYLFSDHDVDELMAREFDFEELDARGVDHQVYIRQVEDVCTYCCIQRIILTA